MSAVIKAREEEGWEEEDGAAGGRRGKEVEPEKGRRPPAWKRDVSLRLSRGQSRHTGHPKISG